MKSNEFKIVNCKYCGEEIDSSSKVCIHCDSKLDIMLVTDSQNLNKYITTQIQVDYTVTQTRKTNKTFGTANIDDGFGSNYRYSATPKLDQFNKNGVVSNHMNMMAGKGYKLLSMHTIMGCDIMSGLKLLSGTSDYHVIPFTDSFVFFWEKL